MKIRLTIMTRHPGGVVDPAATNALGVYPQLPSIATGRRDRTRHGQAVGPTTEESPSLSGGSGRDTVEAEGDRRRSIADRDGRRGAKRWRDD